MGGDGTKQAAFAWPPGEASSARSSEAQEPCPETPPRTGVGGVRGAARREPKLEERLPPDDELWDVRAAARFLKRSVSWVYHKAEDGTLPVKRLGGWGVRFVPVDLRSWVERQHAKADGAR